MAVNLAPPESLKQWVVLAVYFENSRSSALVHLPGFPPSIFLVNVDNVGSNQMHQIRVALRGKGVVLMGKNTMYPQFERLLPHVNGNIGFVFTVGDLKDYPRPCTLQEPSKTSFFQALGIPTKIACGTIEIEVVVFLMSVVQIFDSRNAFSPSVLDVDESELIDRFMSGIKTIAALSLALE
ncbi:hypothetical protein C8R46DRAFT_1304862 [Mycena filopes]|nr:hypothetical protein C8R46DRAFT_1304862 [Mycena filopes]